MQLKDAQTLTDQTLDGLKASGDNKFLLILGEQHKTPSHRAITAQLLNQLHEMNIPVTFAVEIPADYMRQFLHDEQYPAADIRGISNRLEAVDKNGHLRAHAVIGNELYEPDMCALLRTAMNNGQNITLVDKAVPPGTKPTDVAMNDPRTRDAAERLGLSEHENLPALSADGFHLRNELMIESCRAALDAQKGPHVVILLAGKLHAVGAQKHEGPDSVGVPAGGHPYEQSLLALATAKNMPAGAAVLGGMNNMPAAAPGNVPHIEDKIDVTQIPGFRSHRNDQYAWWPESKARIAAAVEDTAKNAPRIAPETGFKPGS